NQLVLRYADAQDEKPALLRQEAGAAVDKPAATLEVAEPEAAPAAPGRAAPHAERRAPAPSSKALPAPKPVRRDPKRPEAPRPAETAPAPSGAVPVEADRNAAGPLPDRRVWPAEWGSLPERRFAEPTPEEFAALVRVMNSRTEIAPSRR